MKCSICHEEFDRTDEEIKQQVDICLDCYDELNYCSDADLIAYGYEGDCQ